MWCGVYLQGGATVHRPGCWIADLMQRPDVPLRVREDLAEKFATGDWRIVQEPVEPWDSPRRTRRIDEHDRPIADDDFERYTWIDITSMRDPPDVRRLTRGYQPAECECRTCGHNASAHVGDGSCLECGRLHCWT